MRRTLAYTLVLILTVGAIGCGGGRERGKNSDFDRPQPQKK
ncbi:hypothetical protein R5W24_006110 [Gemmata sp. JC717]|nr:hypothetical protein [Gemmata algarum]MDY3556934.1 hypothetical protein [Gemmata algarum]